MNKLSPRLQAALRSTDTDSDTTFRLILILSDSVDWIEGTRLVREAGLQIDAEWEELHSVSGDAKGQAIKNMNESYAVWSIDLDGSASATPRT